MQFSSFDSALPNSNTESEKQAPKRWGALSRLCHLFRGVSKPLGIFFGVFLLQFVKWFGIPSAFPCAMIMSCQGRPSVFALLGLVGAFVFRILNGLALDEWVIGSACMLWLIRLKVEPKNEQRAAIMAGLAMIPNAVASCFYEIPLIVFQNFMAVPVAMLSVLLFTDALNALQCMGVPPRARERMGLMLLSLLLISAIAYFYIQNIALGYVAAVFFILCVANVIGFSMGTVSGLFCALALAFSGHDSRIGFGLALCGFLCGLPIAMKKRWLCIPLALFANMVSYYVIPQASPPLGHAEVCLGSLMYVIMPMRIRENLRMMSIGMVNQSRNMENAFMSHKIQHLQQSIKNVATALPTQQEEVQDEANLLAQRLCSECTHRETCYGKQKQQTQKMLASFASGYGFDALSDGDEATMLEKYHCLHVQKVPDILQELSIEKNRKRYQQDRAQFERNLTLTHLAAMNDTLMELGALSTGESLSDLRAAHQITQAIDELRIPATLRYARRVDGHLQVALTMESLLPAKKAVDTLIKYLAREESIWLSVAHLQKAMVELEEIPLYQATVGTASISAGDRADRSEEMLCGDSCLIKRYDGGRMLLILSDGMGHGSNAHQQSQKTLELLTLLLESGYSCRQAMTAVNGIMLTTQAEVEGFSTVDLADLDLWTGEVCSEKLGACASWVLRGNHIKKIEASSLPLGIMEEAPPSACRFHLHSGDIFIMLSDGIVDVYPDDQHMEAVFRHSLFIEPQRMADTILRNALMDSGGVPKDDMCVMVMLLMSQQQTLFAKKEA